jgi:hypothetical protein
MKTFDMVFLRHLVNQFDREEITMSRMLEMLNEKVGERVAECEERLVENIYRVRELEAENKRLEAGLLRSDDSKPRIKVRFHLEHPYWIKYVENGVVKTLHCDMTEICEWAKTKGVIEDYSAKPKDGSVLMPGADTLTFVQFIDKVLTEKDLTEFVIFKNTTT